MWDSLGLEWKIAQKVLDHRKSLYQNGGMRLAERMSRLGTETAFEVFAYAKELERQGKDIIHLEFGEPDFTTPSHIVETAIQALQDGQHHYSPSSGILELREAIAEEIGSNLHISVHPDEVVVTPGAKPIMFFSLLSLAQRGDEVLYPDPGFPIYKSMIDYVGARAVPVPLREELSFRLDVDELVNSINSRTRMVILNSPNNPTGSVLSQDDLGRLAKVLVERDVIVLSDEIYSHMLYEGQHASIASFPGMKEKTIILNGFSKTYAMTGWRLGYGVMERRLAGQITKLMINSNSCTATFSQLAGISALQGDHSPTHKMVTTFQRRRDRVVKLLNQIEGISCQKPLGAFYVFPNIKKLGITSSELADQLLNVAGVALLSGTAFGDYGEGYLRISYATSLENLEEAIKRIAAVVAMLPSRK